MNTLLIILVLLAAFAQWWLAYRSRRLAEAELEIAKTVTAMQEIMLQGTITKGECSHDILYEIMQTVMFDQRYSVPWNLFRGKSKEAVQFAERLEKEIRRENCPFLEEFAKFNRCYFRAFRYKHPLQHVMFPFYLLILYVAAKGIFHTLHAVIHFLKHTEKIKNALRQKYVELTVGSKEIMGQLDGLTA